MLLMLAILALLFVQLRNPNNWRMFGRGDDDKQVVPQPAASRTTATGPASSANPAEAGTPNSDSAKAGTTAPSRAALPI